MSETTKNFVFKIMMDNLQFNVQIRSMFEHQSSTCLRCVGTWDNQLINNQFISQSMPSPRVNEFWKSVNICWSYGNE